MIPLARESLAAVYKVKDWDSHSTFGKLILCLKYKMLSGERPSPTQNERRLAEHSIKYALQKGDEQHG